MNENPKIFLVPETAMKEVTIGQLVLSLFVSIGVLATKVVIVVWILKAMDAIP